MHLLLIKSKFLLSKHHKLYINKSYGYVLYYQVKLSGKGKFKQMKKVMIFLLVFSFFVFGLVTSMLIIHHNREMQMAKQMRTKTAVDGLFNEGAKRMDMLTKSHLGKYAPSDSSENGSSDDTTSTSSSQGTSAPSGNSGDTDVQGQVKTLKDGYIIIQKGNNDDPMFYKVIIPEELQSKLADIQEGDTISVKGSLTSVDQGLLVINAEEIE